MFNPVKEKIRNKISCKDYLIKSKNGLYNCPLCGSGTGKNKTGAVKYYSDTNTWYCHACNNKNLNGRQGDVIDLYKLQHNTDFNNALSLLAQSIGLEYKPRTAISVHTQKQSEFKIETSANYNAYYKNCAQQILKSPEAKQYLDSRGISLKTAVKYGVGYDSMADPANAPGASDVEHKPHPCARLIFPSNENQYTGRSINLNIPKAYEKINAKGSKASIFHMEALYEPEAQIVFVTEGAFDALSIGEAEAQAIALNSAGNAALLIRELEKKKTYATLILALDTDRKGQEAAQVLRDGLTRLNIPFIEADINGQYKDPNDALKADKEAFIKNIHSVVANATKPNNTALYVSRYMASDIERHKSDIKTGFGILDKKTNGLHRGLYIIASITSLGKTSFSLQIADQIAENGNDVIYFSLEQSTLELVSKSIARRTAQKNTADSVSSLAIRDGYLSDNVKQATADYVNAVGDRLSIVEGNFGCDISFIGDTVRNYIKSNKKYPVVVVDYLQIITPSENSRRLSDKQHIDNTVTELKRLSRECDLTIIAVSSVNRANYMQPIDYEALKESGSIEFTADVIWGLQLQCLNEDMFVSDKKECTATKRRARIKEAKAANPRLIELVCLKNRYGIANYSCYFEYYPANDLFKEYDGDLIGRLSNGAKTPRARVTV